MNILSMSYSASVLIVIIFLLRILLVNHIPKKAFYYVWFIVIARLLVPFSMPQFSKNVDYSLPTVQKAAENVFVAPEVVSQMPEIATSQMAATEIAQKASILDFFSLTNIWVVGLLFFAIFFLISHFSYKKKYFDAIVLSVKNWKADNSIRKTTIKYSENVLSPFTYGVFKPIIILPKYLLFDDKKKLLFSLEHEWIHIKRFDIIIKFLLLVCVCVHWFNPLVWLFYVLANKDIELSCDEEVINTFGEKQNSAYANALLSFEAYKSEMLTQNESSLLSYFSKNDLKERIISIMKIKKWSGLTAVIFALCIAFVFVACAATSGKNEKIVEAEPLEATIVAQDAAVEEPSDNEELTENTDDAASTSGIDAETIVKESDLGFYLYVEGYSTVIPYSETHRGIDVVGEQDLPIAAAAAGEVIETDEDKIENMWSYGKYVKISHGNGVYTLYAHCNSINVKKGDMVTQGQIIANVGSTGRSTGNHLHFELIMDDKVVDPALHVGYYGNFENAENEEVAVQK